MVAAAIICGCVLFLSLLGVCAYRQENRKPPPPPESRQQLIDRLLNDPALVERLARNRDVVWKVVKSKGATIDEIRLTDAERGVLRSMSDTTVKDCVDAMWLSGAEGPRAVERVLEIRRQLIAAPR